jgi:hypothetical protein
VKRSSTIVSSILLTGASRVATGATATAHRAPRRADHEQVAVSADRLMQAPGNGARLHRQELGVEGRVVSNRRKPLERALAVVELPLAVRVRARRAHRERDTDEQHISARGDQLVRQLERIPAGLIVVDAYDNVVEHAHLFVSGGRLQAAEASLPAS